MRWWLVAVEFGRFNQSLVHSRHQMIVTQTALVIMHSQQTNSQTAKREEKSLTFFPFCRSIAIFILLTYFNINCQWHAYRWHCSLCACVCVCVETGDVNVQKSNNCRLICVCVYFPICIFLPLNKWTVRHRSVQLELCYRYSFFSLAGWSTNEKYLKSYIPIWNILKYGIKWRFRFSYCEWINTRVRE